MIGKWYPVRVTNDLGAELGVADCAFWATECGWVEGPAALAFCVACLLSAVTMQLFSADYISTVLYMQ